VRKRVAPGNREVQLGRYPIEHNKIKDR